MRRVTKPTRIFNCHWGLLNSIRSVPEPIVEVPRSATLFLLTISATAKQVCLYTNPLNGVLKYIQLVSEEARHRVDG